MISFWPLKCLGNPDEQIQALIPAYRTNRGDSYSHCATFELAMSSL